MTVDLILLLVPNAFEWLHAFVWRCVCSWVFAQRCTNFANDVFSSLATMSKSQRLTCTIERQTNRGRDWLLETRFLLLLMLYCLPSFVISNSISEFYMKLGLFRGHSDYQWHIQWIIFQLIRWSFFLYRNCLSLLPLLFIFIGCNPTRIEWLQKCRDGSAQRKSTHDEVCFHCVSHLSMILLMQNMILLMPSASDETLTD